MLIDLKKLSTSEVYFTMTQTVLPRPIAWVLTENHNHSCNLAPFSYFNAVCSDPPLLMFSIGLQDDGRLKDTLANLQERPDFIVHIASCAQLQDLNLTSATLPSGESEISAVNIATVAVAGFRLPRIADSKVAFMCQVHRIQEIGNNRQSLVFGEISNIYIQDECTKINEKGRLTINPQAIQPLSRLGANQYSTFGQILMVKRPT